MILAPQYVDQVCAVELASSSLPVTKRLYVKDHPRMFGRRPLSYYRRLKSMPNVKLIHPEKDSHALIQNSDMVVTITGTAGLEALFYKRPVLTFGEPNYSKMESAEKIGDPERLSKRIDRILEKHEHDEEELIAYLTAVFEKGFELQTPYSESAQENAKTIIERVLQRFQ